MRIVFALSLAVTLACSGAVRAEEADPAEPTAADRQAVADCLAKAGEEEGGSAFRCIGIVSDPCLAEPDNYNTAMMGACLARESTLWDERLNDDYKALLGGLKGKARDKLKAGQKAWLTVRDTTCDVEASFWQGGSGFGPALIGCMLRETATRDLSLVALRAYLGE